MEEVKRKNLMMFESRGYVSRTTKSYGRYFGRCPADPQVRVQRGSGGLLGVSDPEVQKQ